MLLKEVANSVTHSDCSKTTSLPCVNLLGVSKKKKEEVIKEAYEQFIRNGKETSLLTSMSTSSALFRFVLTSTPQIVFLLGRQRKQNKRYDAMILNFYNTKTS